MENTLIHVDESVFASEHEPSYEISEPEHKMSISAVDVEMRKGAQRLGVGTVDARRIVDGEPVGRTIIVPLAYAAILDPFECQRFEHLADAWGARVVVVENPGIGMQASKLRPLQALGQLGGSFKRTGRVMTRAAITAADLHEKDQVTVLGYSMGASTSAELVAGLDQAGIDVQEHLLVESVANQYHGFRMSGRIGHEDQYTDRYLQTNRGSWLRPPLDRRSDLTEAERAFEAKKWRNSLAVLLGGIALMHGGLNLRLDRVYSRGRNLHNTQFGVINFDQSGMSRAEFNGDTAEIVRNAQREGMRRQLGALATEERLREIQAGPVFTLSSKDGLHHPAWHSIPLITWLGRQLRD